ncbi:MAG: HD domain-containing protein [Bacteroidales bacterium]|nr:HD domain-containing protein [Bacteroidales bacterium]
METNKKKIFNDPIYGFVGIPDELHFDIIEHPYFQRLRRIKQVSLTNLVYPSALHTRFAHSLGTMHLMRRAIYLLRGKGYDISDEEMEAASLAILLHDSGHGPFSHTLENSIVQGITHEDLSLMIMKKFNEIHPGRLDLAIRIFTGTYEKGFLSKLVSSQLDVDRIDYLKRDSFFTGVAEGNVNAERLLDMMEVVDNSLAIEAKGIYSVESFLVARRIMYWQVYMHKTVLSAEYMLREILKRARLISQERPLPATPSLSYFLKRKGTLENTDDLDEMLEQFAKLDDYDVMTAVKLWCNDPDFVLSTLCQRLVNRHLFRIEISQDPFDPNYVDDILHRIATMYGISLYDASFMLLQGVSSNHAYHPKKPAINILYKDGTIKDISEASDQLNISVLSQPVVKHFICYPKELDTKKITLNM